MKTLSLYTLSSPTTGPGGIARPTEVEVREVTRDEDSYISERTIATITVEDGEPIVHISATGVTVRFDG